MQNEFIKELNDKYKGKVIAMPKIDSNDTIVSFTLGKIKCFYESGDKSSILLAVEYPAVTRYNNHEPQIETMEKTYEFTESSFDKFRKSSMWTIIFNEGSSLVDVARLCKDNYFSKKEIDFIIGKEDE